MLRPSPAWLQVYNWVQSLEGLPLWEPLSWALATTYPRALLARGTELSVDKAAEGGTSLALMVEQV